MKKANAPACPAILEDRKRTAERQANRSSRQVSTVTAVVSLMCFFFLHSFCSMSVPVLGRNSLYYRSM